MTVSTLVGKGLYSSSEAAHLINVPSHKIRRWMFGYKNNNKSYKSLWSSEIDSEEDVIGFHDLLELKLINSFRKHGLSINLFRSQKIFAS